MLFGAVFGSRPHESRGLPIAFHATRATVPTYTLASAARVQESAGKHANGADVNTPPPPAHSSAGAVSSPSFTAGKGYKILSNYTPQMRISVGAMESRMDHWRVLTVVRRGGTPLLLGLVGAGLPCGLGLKIVPAFTHDIIGTPVDGFVALF